MFKARPPHGLHASLFAIALGAARTKRHSKAMRIFLWLCGMESQHERSPEDAAPTKPEPVVAALHEDPLVKHVLNVNLILCTCAGIFLWGYYA